MRLLGVRQMFLGATLIAIACSASCSHDSKTSAAAKHVKPSPEESFNTIVETFRRRIEETPIGFVVSDSTGRTSMVGNNKVDSELIRPANDNDPYKAVITVTSESKYSILRTKKETDEATADDQKANAKNGNPLGEIDENGIEALDPALVSKSMPVETTKGTVTVDVIKPPAQPKPDVRNYDLLYENGRWTLVTKLNTKTEQSIQNAFNNALDTQVN